jgi:methylmalonyl-CoA mutase N-terminal domain/subunit
MTAVAAAREGADGPFSGPEHGVTVPVPLSCEEEERPSRDQLECGGAHSASILPAMAATDRRENESGIEIKPVYTAEEAPTKLELPGEYPYTRGPYPDMYRGRPWTMRQYAGFASAEESNARYRYLLERGQTGLSIAFDLPTQLGYDSDDPHALGEVGRTGVAIDSIADMEILLGGIPLDEVSTSMTINAPAALLLLLYELVAEEQGVASTALRGTVQNDILKEYIARGNYIFPPRPSIRLTTDLFAYCAEHVPSWNTISISGYHIREAGSTAVQELAFTIANGIAYCAAAVDAGQSPDEFGARLSFFFNAHNDFFQEVAKFRAARRVWARVMRERFGATNSKALALRFHAQTGGSTLTAQQPEGNIVRVAIQALSAVAGGAQSLHTNSFDEALALPTERAATIALRTQQILQNEAGATATVDPLGGSYYIESLTDELETRAWELIERIDELGGAVAAVEQGFVQGEIENAAFKWQQEVESGERVIVGVNKYTVQSEESIELQGIDPAAEKRQLERTAGVRAERNAEEAAAALARVREAARGTENMLPVLREALRTRGTVGEICGVLREEWGEYDRERAPA